MKKFWGVESGHFVARFGQETNFLNGCREFGVFVLTYIRVSLKVLQSILSEKQE